MARTSDDDAFTGGRLSRASETSGRLRPQDLRGPSNTADLLGAGVMSMLRTTTDTGDLGAISVNHSRGPHLLRQAQRKRFHPSRLSDGSMGSSAASRIPKRSSNTMGWESTSVGHRGSISSLHTTKTGPSYYDENMGPPPHPPPLRSLPPNPMPGPGGFDGRSYSLTQSRGQPQLAVRRSASSLRSQTSTGRVQRPRQPYPPQSRRPPPGWRSVSPAVSDFGPPRPPGSSLPHARPHKHHAPGNAYGQHQLPMARPRAPAPMPQYSQRYGNPQPVPMHHYGHTQHSYPVPEHMHGYHRNHNMYPPPLRHVSDQYQHPPPRMMMPDYELTPPSSGPSSSAPHSSNPTTPQDGRLTRVTATPDFVDSVSTPDQNTDQAIFSSYIAYATKGEDVLAYDCETPPFELDHEPLKDIGEPDVPGAFPTEHEPAADILDDLDLDAEAAIDVDEAPVIAEEEGPGPAQQPPIGSLVQRIKHLLETKAEEASLLSQRARPRKTSEPHNMLVRERQHLIRSPSIQTSLPGQSLEQPKITRDLIKAMTSPSATKLETVHSDVFEIQRPSPLDVPKSSSEYPSEIGDTDLECFLEHVGEHADVSQLERTSSMHSIVDERSDVLSLALDIAAKQERAVEPDTLAESDDVHEQSDAEPGMIEVDAMKANAEDLPALSGSNSMGSVGDDPPSTPDAAPPSSSPPPLSSSCRTSQIDTDVDEIPDSNAGVTSDIITDIAVRFSIPRQTSVAKASIIRVSSNPDQQQRTPKLHEDVFELPSTTSPRNTVFLADSIAPLQVNKKPSTDESTSDGSDLSSFIRRTYPRRQSVLFGDKTLVSDPSTDDRLAIASLAAGRLPGVKEESLEDIILPRPKAMVVTSMSDTALDDKLRAHLSLAEIRDLPSLNFSNVNLIDQLNAALDGRTSFEALSKRASSAIVTPSPLNMAATDALAERYTSFFARPESLQIPSLAEDSESFSVETIMGARKDEQQRRLILSMDQDRVSTMSKSGRGRSLSPSELLGLAEDAERLSVPSVSGLSDRLSELLPSLKRLHLDSTVHDEEAVKHTIEEIHHLGQRPDTTFSVRSSGVLRSLAAIADDIATNGTHSSAIIPPQPRYNKSLPPLPRDMEETEVTELTIGAGDMTIQTISESAASHGSARYGVRRTQSEHRGSSTALFPSSTTQTRRSLTVSTPNSRPWNFDENYPWSTDTNGLSIDFPFVRDHESPSGPTSTPSKTVTHTTTTPSTVQRTSSHRSSLDPTATITNDTLTQHTRKLSAKAASLLGSLSRRARLSPSRSRKSKHSTETLRRSRRPGTAGTVLSSSTVLSNGTNSSRPHPVGDRYPSSALQPHAGWDIDESRSYFSDAESERRRAKRKRWSGMRFRSPDHVEVGGYSVMSSALEQEVLPQGMGRVEFRLKRIGERVRMVLEKGGLLLRRVSGRARRERLRREREWVNESGSVY